MLAPLLPVFGVSRVAGIHGLDRIGIPVFTACRPNSRSLSVFQGKGLTRDAARVSAVMEAYETWCAESPDLPLRFGSVEELRFAHRLIDVTRLPLARPEGLDPQRPFLWIEGRDLIGGGALWVPFEMVHANYAAPEPPHSGAFPATTNGLASGNSRDEAALHALLEVIERDALTLWRLGPEAWGDATALRLDTVDDPACRALLGGFAGAEIDVAAWDITSDIGVPAFVAMINDARGATGAAEIGAGAHLAPDVALARALTEAAQARATFIAGAREDIAAEDYAEAAVAERRGAARAILGGLRPRRDFASIAGLETDSFAGDIDAALAAVGGVGVSEVAMVDLARPPFPFGVARIVAPGLEAAFEGAAEGYVPGPRAARLLREAAE